MPFVSHPQELECIPQLNALSKVYFGNTGQPIIHPINPEEIIQHTKL
jgi:hypothetical protein